MENKAKLSQHEKKIVSIAALGGMLEFYDFIIYGIFSVYFAKQFFPSSSNLLSIIASYVIFILGYFSRPIGGIIFSYIGDEYGRKKVLVATIVIMGISSLGIGILPTYNQIGVTAPILMLVLRLLQGLALGGELPSTYVYISETIPAKRGIGFGITMAGVNSGLLLGMLINQILNMVISPIDLSRYGWRIPFIFGGLLCFVSYKIRKTFQETSEFSKIEGKSKFPLTDLLKNYFLQFVAGTAIIAIMSSLVILAIVFMPTYLHEILNFDNKLISYMMVITMIANIVTILVTGKIVNNYFAMIGLSILAILAILEDIAAMIIPLLVSLIFPTKIRLTGVALCYKFYGYDCYLCNRIHLR